MKTSPFLPFFYLNIIFLGCHMGEGKDMSNPIVEVGGKVLQASVIDQLLPEGTSPEDSTAIVKGYIENWVRNQLVILEAEKNLPADLNLNKLVNDYRSSLLMYHYENQIIKDKLDTIVTAEQKEAFYENYGSQFILSHKIILPVLVKGNKKNRSFSGFVRDARKMDKNEIVEAAKKKGLSLIFLPSEWIPVEDLKSYIPGIQQEKCTKGFVGEFSSGNDVFFVKIFGVYQENEIPPLVYIEDKIEQVMLNQRKNKLLNSIRDELYQININQGNITYHE